MIGIQPRAPFQGRTFVDALGHWARQRPGDIAFRYLVDGENEELELTFADLAQQARDIADVLVGCTQRGERALLLYPRGLEFIGAFLGCLSAGVVAVPAPPLQPARLERSVLRLRAIAADCDASVVLTTRAGEAALAEASADCPELARARRITTDGPSEVHASHCSGGAGARSVERIAQPSDVALLQYTSGSTGTPKGVIITHGNLVHNSECIRRAFRHDDGLVGVGWLPLHHDMGLVGQVLQPLYLGRPCTLLSPLDFLKRPARWLRAISRYGATSSGGPGFAFDLCVRKVGEDEKKGIDLSAWKLAFVGAEPVRRSTLERFGEAFAPHGFRREAFRPAYGLAENTLMVSGGSTVAAASVLRIDLAALSKGRAEPASERTRRPVDLVGSGEPSSEQEVRVVDPELHVPCADGRVGEIWVRSPSVAAGYWNRPEDNTTVFGARLAGSGAEPYLRTGDLGFVERGQLYLAGRIKDIIIVAGEHHAPSDIERSVESCDTRVRQGSVAAFAVEVDDRERLVVVAEVQARRVSEENAAGLDALVQSIRHAIRVEHDIQPFAIWLLPPGALPKTSSGKVQRHACRDGYENGSLAWLLRWVTLAVSEPPAEAESAPLELGLDL